MCASRVPGAYNRATRLDLRLPRFASDRLARLAGSIRRPDGGCQRERGAEASTLPPLLRSPRPSGLPLPLAPVEGSVVLAQPDTMLFIVYPYGVDKPVTV
jgi:hypothetical protein